MKNRIIIISSMIIAMIFAAVMSGCNYADQDNNNPITYSPKNTLKEIVSKDNDVVIERSEVNNSKNNTSANFSSALCLIEDKLYIRTINDDSETEIYEVKTGKTSLIYREDIDTEYHNQMYLDSVLDGKILFKAELDTYLNPENGKFEGTNKNYAPNSEYMAFIKDGMRYFWNFSRIYRYDDGKNTLIATNKDLNLDSIMLENDSFYLTEPFFYYADFTREPQYICRYDTEKKKMIDEVEIPEIDYENASIYGLIAINDDVYFRSDKELYHLNFQTKKVNKLLEVKDGNIIANYYDNKIYVGVYFDNSANGMYVIDLNTKKTEKIYNGAVHGIYILDEQYVYFTTYSKEEEFLVCRLQLKTNDVETIFKNW